MSDWQFLTIQYTNHNGWYILRNLLFIRLIYCGKFSEIIFGIKMSSGGFRLHQLRTLDVHLMVELCYDILNIHKIHLQKTSFVSRNLGALLQSSLHKKWNLLLRFSSVIVTKSPNPQFPADLVTFTEQIINGKLHFLCSAYC